MNGLLVLIALSSGVVFAEKIPEAAPSASAAWLSLPAFDLEVDAEVSKPPYQVGDRIALKIIGSGVEKLDLSRLQVEPPPGGESLEDQGWHVFQEGSKLLGVPLKPGSLSIPSLLIKDEKDVSVARTNPLALEVASAISPNDPKPKEPAPPRPPLGLPFPTWVLWLAGLTLVVLTAGIVLGLVYLSKRRKQQKTVAFAPPPLPPRPEDEIVLEALARLERENWMKQGKHKVHFFGVSDILKVYIGARYRFDAIDRTAREILQSLEENAEVSIATAKELQALFEALDLVKFTDHSPTTDDGKKALEGAREFVLKTRKRVMPSVLTTPTSEGKAGQNALQ